MEYTVELEFSIEEFILLKQLLNLPVAHYQKLVDNTSSAELKTIWTKNMEEAQALLNKVKEG